jgi:hypothetical protein
MIVIFYTHIPSLQGSSWRLQEQSFTLSLHSNYTHLKEEEEKLRLHLCTDSLKMGISLVSRVSE